VIRVKFPPAISDGHLVVVVTDGRRDRILERRTDMPIGTWGEVPLPSGNSPRRKRTIKPNT